MFTDVLSVSQPHRPLVLVHGLWDTPKLFGRLVKLLEQHQVPLLIPHLPHRLGVVPLSSLAKTLDALIVEQWGSEMVVDVLGFSMGGVISRVWLQHFGGARRTHRFLSVGSPQQGTLTAQWIPNWLFAGLADMKRGSPLLRKLNSEVAALHGLDCTSFFCRWDLMVFPGWQAVLPVGKQQQVPVITHQQLMTNPRALELMVSTLLGD
ncbi:MAG: esterase/lipase family protein [Prochlorococcus sp.]|jgi:triacylglycerol lipase|nr:alpha/beta hydrolase [Prochlorococcaceae cyanobacterium ETNP18_MAG_14]MDP6321899.1 alpha/beta hydrolase [Prochlorococcaceae cyanobacterium ETNP14_MAG_5]|tara:strand:+ start:10910 stop:11530 length:621 start_codon:yes stop_codon:yes gene_type:complete